MGPLGWQETVFIFVLALLIFGPKKLPELGKTVAKAITEFRRASSELKSTFDREMSAIEQESQSLKEVTRSYENQISNYDDSYYDSGYSNGSESSETAASNPSTVSASASQDAESPAETPAEGDATNPPVQTAAESEGGKPAVESETVRT
jgi:TatA/E family protein of Tat protein translocase